jgi:maltose alpha-D-glucosyltransferase / alpha-amylase
LGIRGSAPCLLDAGRRGEEKIVKMDSLWYKDAIFYELHVRTFADSNADGTGDFAGARQKLDYLQDLGITCI